ncbi:hypothetical protein V1282_003557 [Nitrobacteraceae bacterium AZCC 2146]
MQFRRFMTAQDFAREIDALRIFRHEHVGGGLMESLEASRLLHPRIRIRYPDEVARRLWLEQRGHEPPRTMHRPLEPDGRRWDAAVDLNNALYRWQNRIVYGRSAHPLDEPEPRFAQFLERPSEREFVPRSDRRLDVGSDLEDGLSDDSNCDDRFTTWQVLLAAELAESGIRIRLDLGNEGVLLAARDALAGGRLPPGADFALDLVPAHATHAYASTSGRSMRSCVSPRNGCAHSTTFSERRAEGFA